MTSTQALEALCMDLKRVAIGYNRGSITMGDIFKKEALQRRKEIAILSLKPYMQKIINSLETILQEKNPQTLAEDALTYSTIILNYITRK